MTHLRAIQSSSASIRLREARTFLDQFPPGDEVLLLGASRGAVDDLARTIAMEKGATFGLHRLSFTQLAARLAARELAARGQAPASALGTRPLQHGRRSKPRNDEALEYFAPVSNTQDFPKPSRERCWSCDWPELRRRPLARIAAQRAGSRRPARSRRHADGARPARATVHHCSRPPPKRLALSPQPSALHHPLPLSPMPVLLLDVPFDSEAEAQFLWALVEQARHGARSPFQPATRARSRSSRNAASRSNGRSQPDGRADLAHALALSVFQPSRRPSGAHPASSIWFSAPGEGRECVEIARRMLKEAANGVRFDEMAILIRSPQQYLGVLEHALAEPAFPPTSIAASGVLIPPAGRSWRC